MIEIRQLEEFSNWLRNLRDTVSKAKILVRIDRIMLGLLGDAKSVGEKVYELRIDYGPGYRIYFTRKGRNIILLLLGGDKSSQKRDIKKAKKLARDLEKKE